MKLHFILAIFAFTLNYAHARDVSSMNADWKFALGEQNGAQNNNYDDATWRQLDLPHDWSIEGEYDEANPMGDQCGYLPAGIGWYRKTIEVDEAWRGKFVELTFDGIFMNSTVWINGEELGTRPYGWIPIVYDISSYIENADKVTISVRVDNDLQPSARWYTGSGIYANTWLKVTDPVHIPTSGVFVKTEGSTVHVATELASTLPKGTKSVSLQTTILDMQGNVVAKAKVKSKVTPGLLEQVNQTFSIDDVQKWGLSSPYLYTVVSEVLLKKKVVDVVETRFGMRDVVWIPETGMWINGENIKLQGVCNHQDAGALGAAVPDKILRFRIQQLKDMGCNTIRTAHNPQTPQFYDMCDEMGMLVMDEIFDGWHKKAEHDYGAYHFDKWWKQDLTDWMRRDRNHPSVVIYSVGNETRGEVASELVALCHSLDDTRPVTSGHSGSPSMDVLGVNGHSEKMGWFEELKHDSDRVFIGTENTHTWQVRGYYRSKTWYRDGYPNKRQQPYYYPDLTDDEVFTYDWTDAAGRQNFKQVFNSSYDNAMVRLNSRQNIEQLRDIPNFAGTFRWTGHDYIGEAGYVHGGWPFKSFMGGAIDMANFEKDLFYLYQSQWTSKPMVHILPHWTHPTMKANTEIPVWVYSNCEEVELLLNGESLGMKKPGLSWDKMQCEWLVPYVEGELIAVAYTDGKEMCRKVIRTAEAPSRFALSVDGENLTNTKGDVAQVRVTTTDNKDEFYPYGENRTYFAVTGEGKIRALDNGSPIDVEKHFEAKDRIAFFGLTRAYVEATADQGDINLIAASILGEKKLITSDLVHIDVQQLNLRGKSIQKNVKIYYTIDGSTPTVNSTIYNAAIKITLGTTVKALVVADGETLFVMEERFADDVGFVWESAAVAANPGGDQAEDAKFGIANISDQGEGFNGKGFLDFGRNNGGYVEWYQENDGSEGEFTITVRYSAASAIRPEYKVALSVNGKSQEIVLPALKKYKKEWLTYTTNVTLGSGANSIRITSLQDDGLSIDELKVE